MPGYVEKAAALKAKGVEVIACISVNDPFVMEAWGKAHNADGKASLCNFFAFVWEFSYYVRQHMCYRRSVCPSVRLSVRLSDEWIIQKRLKLGL